MNDPNPNLVSFECESLPIPPGTPAVPRPPGRPREVSSPDPVREPELVAFECTAEIVPPGTPAAPRPLNRPRILQPATPPTEADTVFARELADRVLEYVRNRPSGLSAEQLAVLVQQFLARRSA